MLRNIGMKGVECSGGVCIPWSKVDCRSCGNRPLKIYQGNGNTERIRDICRSEGYGVMISPGGCSTPQFFEYYALDNGAFSAWKNRRSWDSDRFLKLIERSCRLKTPDFIVTPDKVAAGIDSLVFSLTWRKDMPELADTRYYLAVQDGMQTSDVGKILDAFEGIFVGGTLGWKYRTAHQWVELAHRHFIPCHIGRVGTWKRILWVAMIGADSIDSSSWARNDSFHHIQRARDANTLPCNTFK